MAKDPQVVVNAGELLVDGRVIVADLGALLRASRSATDVHPRVFGVVSGPLGVAVEAYESVGSFEHLQELVTFTELEADAEDMDAVRPWDMAIVVKPGVPVGSVKRFLERCLERLGDSEK